MQVINQTGDKISDDKKLEIVTIKCDDNGVDRFYTFENITAHEALHRINALYSMRDIKLIHFKNYKK